MRFFLSQNRKRKSVKKCKSGTTWFFMGQYRGQRYYGYFNQRRQMIALATPEEKTFFHELAHAAHSKIKTLRDGQHWAQEIVAELSAAVLCRIAGKDPKDTLGISYRYIERYAKQASMSPYAACVRVLKEVEQVLDLVLAPALEKAA